MSDHQNLADRYAEIAKIIYNNIEDMSITKPSFSNWLKITALTDLETLLFGLFASTYPKESEVTIGCENRKCEKDII